MIYGAAPFTAMLAVAAFSAAVGAGAVLSVHRPDSVNSSHSLATRGAQPTAKPPGSLEEVAAKVVSSVVTLENQDGDGSDEGSGIVVSSDGLIVTSGHVVAALHGGSGGVANSFVTLSDGRTASFTVVGTDSISDIAVVRAQGISGLTPITVGSSANLHVGEEAVAVGSPLGLESSVTVGIISALHRPVAAASTDADPNAVLDAIQTDAALNPGNSGGALVNTRGELIGMNSAIATTNGATFNAQSGSIGLGFAIPVDEVKRIADELIGTGKAAHASLGIQVSSDQSTRGAKVTGVTRGGPAAAAGLSNGVLITGVDGQAINDVNGLAASVVSRAPGDAVTLAYHDTSGADRTAHVTLGTDQAQQ
ncbi:S1C family serine protease [Mycobacterium sp.]|jgi:putative serine protease PepD|uniref:S1C family serine protease n=1 Tax=Mycobacterium sp. TaxID=1785 RepID=UPI002D4BB086|nr:trypsin-like peptidase domain-containing protein [Mycobacterium sp.]HZA12360.1 trypsin-like peptidase domain-containing protein [Mycobacterium sp.]